MQRPRHAPGRCRIELAILKKQLHDRPGHDKEQHRRRQIDKKQVPRGFINVSAEFAIVFLRRITRQGWQQKGGQRNAEEPLRQFHQSHRVAVGCHHVFPHEKPDTVNRQHIDLKRRHPQHTRSHSFQDRAHGIVLLRVDPSRPEALAPKDRQLVKQLRHPGHQHAHRQREHLVLQLPSPARRQPQHRRDHHHVHDHRAQGRQKEMPARVQHAHHHGRQADQHQVREHPPQQFQHERGFFIKLAPRQRQRNAQQPHAHHAGQHHDKAADEGVGCFPHGFFALGFFLLLENGNERHSESALAEQATEEIGDHEGQHEGARHEAIAHEPRVANLTHHAQHAAGERGPSHRPGGFEHVRH